MIRSLRTLRGAAAGVVGTGALTGALLFGGAPVAQAAPLPTPGTGFAAAGPLAGPGMIPDRPGFGGGHGFGGHGHGFGGHRMGHGMRHGGWGRGWGHHGGMRRGRFFHHHRFNNWW